MSKNISIQEGGVGRQFTADKLKTTLAGGGSCTWVPEDEVKLSSLRVTQNGTYRASDAGGYGYSQVTVNVPGGAGGAPGRAGSSIVGTDPGTGNTTLVSVDRDGTLQRTDLPYSIKIETPPTKVDYIDGSAMDYSGMVVKAYLRHGDLWTDADHPDGIIPLSELVLAETEADISKSTTSKGTRTLDGVSVEVACILEIAQYANGQLNRSSVDTCPAGVLIVSLPHFGGLLAVSDDSNAAVHFVNSQDGMYLYRENERGQQGFNDINTELGISRVTGKPIYYGYIQGYSWSGSGNPWTLTVDPVLAVTTGIDDITAADIALYGTGNIGGGETIPVVWRRPGDAQELTDSFRITVIEHVIPQDDQNSAPDQLSQN